jgi:alpha-D-ribose 1-methylphosphonate 5-triphosphate synthase subunit PhnH
MKTDLIVLKTRLLKNYKELEKNSEALCLWLNNVETAVFLRPKFRKDIVKAIKPPLELIIHE